MLSPKIIHRAICGTLPEDISLAKLYKLPDRREEQLKQLGIAVEYFGVCFCKILLSNAL